MPEHIIYIGEVAAPEGDKFRAHCLGTPRCGFTGPWHSATEFENSHENASGDVTVDSDGTQAALDAATADGDDHLAGLEFGP